MIHIMMTINDVGGISPDIIIIRNGIAKWCAGNVGSCIARCRIGTALCISVM